MFRNNSECYGTLWTTCTHGKVDHFPFSLRIQSWSYTQFSKYPSFDCIAWLRRYLLCPLALIWVVILVQKIFLSPQLGLSSFLYICLVLFIHWVIAHFRVFSSVQSLGCVQLFVIPWSAAHQASLAITKSWSLLKFMSIKSVMSSTISSYVVPFSSSLQS